MENQQKNFRTVQAGPLSPEIFNASEDSFGVASVIISGKEDAVLVDAETVAQRIRSSEKISKQFIFPIMIRIFISGLRY